MHWIVIALIAIAFGWLYGLVTRPVGFGSVVSIPVSLIGALLGATLSVVALKGNGLWSFYGLACAFSIVALGGALYAFVLTSSERRL